MVWDRCSDILHPALEWRNMKTINIKPELVNIPSKKTSRTKKLLLVVLPYIVKNSRADTKKKAIRSFLAFPYGVLTIASYVEKNCINNPIIEVLDLNIESNVTADEIFEAKLTF